MPRLTVACSTCRSVVERWPSDLVRGGKTVTVFCSTACRSSRVTRPCSTCGAPVTRRASVMPTEFVFCSISCRDASADWHAARLAARWPAGPTTAKCDHCGGTFTRPPSGLAGGRVYCSTDCRAQAGRAARECRTCATCGGPVRRWPSEWRGERAFCSPACRRSGAYNQVSALEERACLHCGHPFTAWRSEPHRFCSQSCWGRHRWRRGLAGVAVILTGGADARRRWRGRWGAISKAGRPSGALSHWTRAALPALDETRRRLEREFGRRPSLRELEQATGVPKSTIARLSQ